jgi:hypothetical protein
VYQMKSPRVAAAAATAMMTMTCTASYRVRRRAAEVSRPRPGDRTHHSRAARSEERAPAPLSA